MAILSLCAIVVVIAIGLCAVDYIMIKKLDLYRFNW